MKYKTLGNTSEKVSATGLGCMGMSHAYGNRDSINGDSRCFQEENSTETFFKHNTIN